MGFLHSGPIRSSLSYQLRKSFHLFPMLISLFFFFLFVFVFVFGFQVSFHLENYLLVYRCIEGKFSESLMYKNTIILPSNRIDSLVGYTIPG